MNFAARSPAALTGPPGGSDTLVLAYDGCGRTSHAAWVAATIERFGRIDAVVCNAGILMSKNVVEAEDHEVDVTAHMRLIRAAWPDLVAQATGA